jgi:hypothetical protein
MNKLRDMKEILRISRVDRKKYEIVWSDDTVDIVCPNNLPDSGKILSKGPVLSVLDGTECGECGCAAVNFYRYEWKIKSGDDKKVFLYDRNKFQETHLVYVCPFCFWTRFPWESQDDEIIDISGVCHSLKVCHELRLGYVSYNPDTCPGSRCFALARRQGALWCAHYPICNELGCTPMWVYSIKDSWVITLDDIIRGKPFVYLTMELPFWSP